eukprot:jgi/Picsp_1/577/NSC_00574-R1_cell division cycle protein 14
MDGEAEIIPGVLHLHYTKSPATPAPTIPPGSLYYWLDSDLIYEPFCADFGPCNLAITWKFCQRVNYIVGRAEEDGKMAYLVVGPHPHKRANAAVLTGLYMVLFMDISPEKAFQTICHLEPFARFRDASSGIPSYTLAVEDVLKGMYRAKVVGFINWHRGEIFDVDEYEHYEQVENGDLNWIVPGKFLAFAGPSGQAKYFGGWRTFTPEDYVDYFKQNNVTSVVRLNKKMYDGARFSSHGINHHDLYFPDGTCPSDMILQRFLQIAENEPGALAIHCKAGLGRTGVLICCYMMKHYGFTAEEAMGYIRICRPGSVIGPQQHYLLQQAALLRQEGLLMGSCRLQSSDPTREMPEGVVSSQRPIIDIIATSRTVDLLHQTTSDVDMSGTEDNLSQHDEQDEQMAIPARRLEPISPEKQPNESQYHIHVDAKLPKGNPNTPEKDSTFAPMPSLQPSPVRDSSGEICYPPAPAATPIAATNDPRVPPPSSTKRVLAPNGQPRKIPLAVNFDDVAASLEDKEAADHYNKSMPSQPRPEEEDWSVGSQPVIDQNYNTSGKVGAFAAAAGRGANAFVEAFRSVVSAHRSNYRAQRN